MQEDEEDVVVMERRGGLSRAVEVVLDSSSEAAVARACAAVGRIDEEGDDEGAVFADLAPVRRSLSAIEAAVRGAEASGDASTARAVARRALDHAAHRLRRGKDAGHAVVLAKWLLAKANGRPAAARGASGAIADALRGGDGGDKWAALAAAQVLRQACASWSNNDGTGRVAAALAACAVEMEVVEALEALADRADATQAAVSAVRAVHDLVHAAACGVHWAEAQDPSARDSSTATIYTRRRDEDVDSDDEDDPCRWVLIFDDGWSNDDGDVDRRPPAAMGRVEVGARCRKQVWRWRGALGRATACERRWHASSPHRAAYVAALDDFVAECEAVSEFGTRADEILALARVASRDGRDPAALEAAAAATLEAAAARLAWLSRSFSPTKSLVKNKSSSSAAKMACGGGGGGKEAPAMALRAEAEELEALAAEETAQALGDPIYDSDDDEGEGEGEGAARRLETNRAEGLADVRRSALRRFAALLGSLKPARLDEIFQRDVPLQRSLQQSIVVLLRASKPPPPAAGGDSRDAQAERARASERCAAACAKLAAIAMRRLVEGTALGGGGGGGGASGGRKSSSPEEAAAAAAPFIALLTDEDRDHDQASACIGEILAPLALSSGAKNTVLPELLGKVASGHRGALEALRCIVAAAGDGGGTDANDPEWGARAREAKGHIAVELARRGLQNDGASSSFKAAAVSIFAALDPDVAIPALAAELAELSARASKKKTESLAARQRLEQAICACVEGDAPAAALLCLARALRDVVARPEATRNAADLGPAYHESTNTTGGDDLDLEKWAEHLLRIVPAAIAKLARGGGERWVCAARRIAAHVSTAAKDAAAVRLWGAVADELAATPDAALEAVRAVAEVIESQAAPRKTGSEATEEELFERLAPLLTLKRLPVAAVEAAYGASAAAVERVGVLVRRRAYAAVEQKAISTVAAEVLGRLPFEIGGALDAAARLGVLLRLENDAHPPEGERSAAESARVAIYALCHAATSHGADKVRDGAPASVDAVLTYLAHDHLLLEDASNRRDAEQIQAGCIHALAMIVGAEAISAAVPSAAAPRATRPLVVEVVKVVADHQPSTARRPGGTSTVTQVLGDLGGLGCGVDDDGDDDTSGLLLEMVGAALRNRLRSPLPTLRLACAHACTTAAQQLPATKVPALAAAITAAALRHASSSRGRPRAHSATTDMMSASTPPGSAEETAVRAAWVEVVFVLLVRGRAVPAGATAQEIHGVALDATRHKAASAEPYDVALRRSGVKVLASLVGIDADPPLTAGSIAQAIAALRGAASLEPNKDLRQLAAGLLGAIST